MKNADLKRRILTLSYKHKLSHLGSCITAVDIIDEIYATKKPDEKFVLSSGHAGLALYCVIEKYRLLGLLIGSRAWLAEDMFNEHGVHPDRCERCGIDCSSGSLGQGLPIAVGMALADRSKNVYCLVSDGEVAEGSIWEAIRLMHDKQITNLKLYVNWNGYGAYDESSKWAYATLVGDPMVEFRVTKNPGFLAGLQGHYKVMSEEEYKEALNSL